MADADEIIELEPVPEKKGCCACMCESCVQIGAVLSVSITIAGIVAAYLGKTPVIASLAGFGVSTAPDELDRFCDYFFMAVIGVSILALIPISYANPQTRKRLFGAPEEEAQGCCAACCGCCGSCIACILGNVVTSVTEVIVFLTTCICLVISYVFLLGATVLIFFSDICEISGSAPGLTQALLNALNDTEIGEFVQGINVAVFCADPDNTSSVLENEGRLVVGGLLVAIIGQVCTFQATSKAKEAIQAESFHAKEVRRASRQQGTITLEMS